MIRALCTDIDGTLLDSQRQLSARTITAIKSISKDIPVVLASSRMPSAMRHLQGELEILQHPLICYNGGYVLHYDTANNTPLIVDSVCIAPFICSDIFNLTKTTKLHVSLYQNDNWYAHSYDQWTEREATITKVSPTITELNTVLDNWHVTNTGAHKIMCMGDSLEIDNLQKILLELFGEHVHAYRSKSTYLEIAPRAVSKASALKLLLSKYFNIDMIEVIAFGDNYNDIDLLKSVGLGIAVENARNEVKAIAKEITLNNKADGVAVMIEKYFGRS